MKRSIFRQSALDRLSSADSIDRPVRIVRPAGWIALAALLVAILAAAGWVVVAEVPEKVQGHGIVMQAGGLAEIRAVDAGRVESLRLVPGLRVEAGEIVATIGQNDLLRQLENARANLAAAKERLERLELFYAESARREDAGDRERLNTIAETERLLRGRLALLQQRLDSVRDLVGRGNAIRDRLIEAEIAVADARERLAQLGDETTLIGLRKLERESQRRIELLDQRLRAEDFEREVARLDKLLSERQAVRSPHTGIVLEVKINPGDVVVPGAALATVAPDGGADLYGVLYVGAADGKRLQPGMRVEIAPTTVRREEFGYMLGEIEEVSALPATAEGMRHVLQNDELARRLSADGTPFAAKVRLERDTATPSGFAWSSSRGPEHTLTAGELFEARIVVRRLRLANLLAPGFDGIVDRVRSGLGAGS
ncbi:MAG: NHLP bacteriocin system secretion protein [Alphaproteobacteria bacterium]